MKTAIFANDGLNENRYHYTSAYQHGFITSNASQARVMNAFGCDFEHVKDEEYKRSRILQYLDSLALRLYRRPCASCERIQTFAAAWAGDRHE